MASAAIPLPGKFLFLLILFPAFLDLTNFAIDGFAFFGGELQFHREQLSAKFAGGPPSRVDFPAACRTTAAFVQSLVHKCILPARILRKDARIASR